MTLYTGYQQFTASRFMKKSFLAILSCPPSLYTTSRRSPKTPPQSSMNAQRRATSRMIPGPLATDLSPSLKRPAILKAMKKVADWQLQHSEGRYNIQWTFAALYDGLLAASKTTGDKRYHDRVLQVARDNHWELGPRFAHADDEAVGLTYLCLLCRGPETGGDHPHARGHG